MGFLKWLLIGSGALYINHVKSDDDDDDDDDD